MSKWIVRKPRLFLGRKKGDMIRKKPSMKVSVVEDEIEEQIPEMEDVRERMRMIETSNICELTRRNFNELHMGKDREGR